MKIELTPRQKSMQNAFRAFVRKEIAPYADQYDREEAIPAELIQKLAQSGYLGSMLPQENGGLGLDMIAYGLLHGEIGRACSSVRSLLTVHDMVAYSIYKWGNEQQKKNWLPKLASGEAIAAFGLTEPTVGSDAKSIETAATLVDGSYVLSGQKKWITFGQVADLFLIFARCDEGLAAFLVEGSSLGFSVKPISGLLGMRASMLAELFLEDCRVPKENLLGRAGFGLSHIASTALTLGRYTVAWGCVGIAQACLEACVHYASERKQFGSPLGKHQLIRQMLTDMIVNVNAARLLCYQAGYLMDSNDPQAIMEASMAKYFASVMAVQAASNAVQIHGANGCSSAYPVQRYFRDAKIMEIIEGSTQIQQITIAQYGFQD
jgi:alkylation response protein AidB-like acyl-CoA dehydrogenase